MTTSSESPSGSTTRLDSVQELIELTWRFDEQDVAFDEHKDANGIVYCVEALGHEWRLTDEAEREELITFDLED